MEEYVYDEETRLKELKEMVINGLDESLDDDTFQKLADIQLDLQTCQEALNPLLEFSQITPEEYLDRIDEICNRTMNEAKDLLGEERFVAVFGEEALESCSIIDREIFLTAHNQSDEEMRIMTEKYEKAQEFLDDHIHREDDGTFTVDTMFPNDSDIDREIFFNLLESLDKTNELIRTGKLKSSDIS